MSLAGHRISRTLLLGLVHSGRWGILQFLYQTFDACWRILSVEKLLSLLCSNGGIVANANGLRCFVSRGCCGFVDFLVSKRPDFVVQVRAHSAAIFSGKHFIARRHFIVWAKSTRK